MRVIFEANDGKQFKTKGECEEYEKKSEDIKKAKEALTLIKEVCSKHTECAECLFYLKGNCMFENFGYGFPQDFLEYFEKRGNV